MVILLRRYYLATIGDYTKKYFMVCLPKDVKKIIQYSQLLHYLDRCIQHIKDKLDVTMVERIIRNINKLSEKIDKLAQSGFIKKIHLERGNKQPYLIKVTIDGEHIIQIVETLKEIDKYREAI